MTYHQIARSARIAAAPMVLLLIATSVRSQEPIPSIYEVPSVERQFQLVGQETLTPLGQETPDRDAGSSPTSGGSFAILQAPQEGIETRSTSPGSDPGQVPATPRLQAAGFDPAQPPAEAATTLPTVPTGTTAPADGIDAPQRLNTATVNERRKQVEEADLNWLAIS